MNIVFVNLRYLLVVVKSFVLCVKHYIFFIKVRIPNSTVVIKKIYTSFAKFILGMHETYFL